ncbi:protein of unknown function [Azospirillum baldaniorum]|uniref:Uncharacterized protein n=1 Tax=Azospirillum baldaniorum TaxID=1064539 RepID=A0A9P1JT10_9PROT|nr:protein of unknown function [Azospirillum baldaniorum]
MAGSCCRASAGWWPSAGPPKPPRRSEGVVAGRSPVVLNQIGALVGERIAAHPSRPTVLRHEDGRPPWDIPDGVEVLLTRPLIGWDAAPAARPAGWGRGLRWIQSASTGMDVYPPWLAGRGTAGHLRPRRLRPCPSPNMYWPPCWPSRSGSTPCACADRRTGGGRRWAACRAGGWGWPASAPSDRRWRSGRGPSACPSAPCGGPAGRGRGWRRGRRWSPSTGSKTSSRSATIWCWPCR